MKLIELSRTVFLKSLVRYVTLVFCMVLLIDAPAQALVPLSSQAQKTCPALSYSIEELPGMWMSSDLYADNLLEPQGMNDASFVVGTKWHGIPVPCDDGDGSYEISCANRWEATPLLWTPKNGLIDLSSLLSGVLASSAAAINRRNDIVGTAYPSSPISSQYNGYGFLLRADGTLKSLAFPNEYSQAVAINSSGAVVGSTIPYAAASDFYPPRFGEAFIYTQARGMRRLGKPNGKGTKAIDINSSGEVLVSDFFLRAYLWTSRSGMVDLTAKSGEQFSRPIALNDRGEAVGSSATLRELLILRRDGTVDNLGGLPRAPYIPPSDMNNAGDIIGRATYSGYNEFFLYRRACARFEKLQDLITDDSGWDLWEVRKINNNGDIMGVGYKNRKYRGYLMRRLN